MKTRIYNRIVFFLLFFVTLPANGQELGFEKLYVQTDKTFYTQEDVIWYKAFLVDAHTNKPSTISDVVYVELHDPKGNVLEKQELLVKEGICNGEFVLNKEYAGGLYKLVAYTRWMGNQHDETSFQKELTIQKVITPRLLLKLEFEKRAYGGGDEVEATLHVTDLNNVPANDATIKADVRLNGKQVETVNSRTEQGVATLRFKLPEQLTSADGILQVLVNYSGVNESITRSIPIVLNRIDLGFYPEGGEMINGFCNRVAFQALNEFGKGADISGEIIDQHAHIITTFESYHLGMGSFEITPEDGKTYFARITRPLGNEETIPLPLSKNDRYGLKLDSRDDKKTVWSIYAPADTKKARLKASIHGVVQYDEVLTLHTGVNTVDVNTTGFPAGIAVFTLLDEYGRGQAERLVFVNSFKTLQIKLNTRDTYLPASEASIDILTTDEEGNPVSAMLGLAIVDEQLMTFANDKQDHIVSYLLLSSDLKGDIEEPSFYFDKKEPKSEKGLDYLLLTHGWRQFIWDELVDPATGQIKTLPEKASSISGTVKNKKGNSVEGAEVFLIERNGKRRIGRVVTNRQGQFTFHDADISAPITLATLLPNSISFEFTHALLSKNTKNEENIPEIVSSEIPAEDVPAAISPISIEESMIESDVVAEDFFGSFSDNAILDEVVITGYGTQKRSDISSAVSYIRGMETIKSQNLNGALLGLVAGLRVIPSTNPAQEFLLDAAGYTTPGSFSGLQIVIDGLPIYRPYPKAFSYINPATLSTVELYKNVGGNAKYGSQSANGVLHIETRTINKGYYDKSKGSPYHTQEVLPRRFYSPAFFETASHNSDLLQPTVHWEGTVKTDENGKAKIYFQNNNQTSSFRITAEGMSPVNGLTGHVTHSFITEKPLSIDMKLPILASLKDNIRIPVLVRNTTPELMETIIDFVVRSQQDEASLQNRQEYSHSYPVTVPPNSTQTLFIPFPQVPAQGSYSVAIRATDIYKNSAHMTRTITLRETNFPLSAGFSGNGKEASTSIDIPEHIPGSLQAELTIYGSILDELLDGVENIFRAPYGCFEQVSSSTMPNIFALQLLNSSGFVHEDIRNKATGYLKDGYKKLVAYEIGRGGFEWFGHSPAHQVLSAYGLIEFTEMAKVYDEVDQKIISRTINYLLNQRNGKGGFRHNKGKYGFSGVPDVVGNAYIVYAITESGYGKDIEPEYEASLQEVMQSKDLYRMALLANAAYTRGDTANYKTLIEYFRSYLEKKDFDSIQPEATIVYSSNRSLETVAFWLLALLKDTDTYDPGLVDLCVNYISKGKRMGGYGNTQATSVCLQALARYVEKTSVTDESSSFSLTVNEQEYSGPILKNKKTVADVSPSIKKGNNKMDLFLQIVTRDIIIVWISTGILKCLLPVKSVRWY